MEWNKKEKCKSCGIKYENGKPIFKDCFQYGFSGGTLNISGRGMSICDFGSLRYCKWDIKRSKNNDFWIVQGDKANLIYPTKEKLFYIQDFKEYEDCIEIIDVDNNKHKLCCCDCIYVEWLPIRYLKIDRNSLKL